MDIDVLKARKGSSKTLVNAERQVLIAKMLDKLSEGYMTSYALSKQLHVSIATIDSYRGLVDELIAKTKLDRNVIRNLQIRRTYKLIEMLMVDLGTCSSIKERSVIYGNIFKFSSHLALITGLNVETHVTVDPTKLVIIRSNNKKNTPLQVESTNTDSVEDLPATV